ncbi:hypothetical protein D3C85_1830590 [compost metagenome]
MNLVGFRGNLVDPVDRHQDVSLEEEAASHDQVRDLIRMRPNAEHVQLAGDPVGRDDLGPGHVVQRAQVL